MEEDNISRVEINAHDGAQINIALGNGVVHAEQYNRNEDVVNRFLTKSRTQEYADKWNKNMFLNDFDKRDENAGIDVKLSEVYLEEHLPHYIWKTNVNEFEDLKKILSEYINNKTETKMLLILGQPGIGKSTLITWITANFSDKINNILVYKFASDLKKIDWRNSDVSQQILLTLNLSYYELNGKTLILDGFDEVNIGDNRKDILDSLYESLIYKNDINNFTLIILCRENYINKYQKLKCDFITLQTWNDKQIENFCKVFSTKISRDISEVSMKKFIENKEVFGIPLILYMVLALEISIEKNSSIVDVYDKIFSLEGGIYDRCINNKNFSETHRIGEIKLQIHQISREIAMWMFENIPDEAFIPQREYENICINVIKESQHENVNIIQDSQIGNYFKTVKHCEGVETERILFVHRSLYEYFVTEYLFMPLIEIIEKKGSEKILAAKLGDMLKGNSLSNEILNYLKYKINKSILSTKFNFFRDTFQLMTDLGMTYFTNKCYRNVIKCEMSVFANMLEILHLWENCCLEFDDTICDYLRHNAKSGLNLGKVKFNFNKSKGIINNCHMDENMDKIFLSGANLSGANLSGAVLKGINLSGASLIGANLRFACLASSNLNFADLQKADLIGADLTYADIRNIDFHDTILNGADIRFARLGETDFRGASIHLTKFDEKQIEYIEKQVNLKDTRARVYIYNTEEIVSYEDYCNKRNNTV